MVSTLIEARCYLCKLHNGSLEYWQTWQVTSQIQQKNFIVDATKPIADPVEGCLENLAKQALKLVKPIRACNSSSFTE